ncbi:MAG: MFS transporter [Bacillota bacterium]
MNKSSPIPDTSRANVVWLSATTTVMLLWFFSWNRLLPLILRELGASNFHVSVAFSLIMLAMGLLQYPGGLLADRVGRKHMIVFPTFVAGLAYIVGSTLQDWRTLVVVLALTNAMSSMQWPSFSALLAESVPADRRGMAFATFELFIAMAVSAGPMMGAWLLPMTGFRVLMAATGAVAVAMGAVRHFRLRETLAQDLAYRLRFDPAVLLERRVFLLLLASTLFTLGNSQLLFGPFVSLYASDVHGLSGSLINLMFAFGPLAGMTVALLGGKITERYGSSPALRAGALAHVALMLVWLRTGTFIATATVLTLSYVFFQLAMIAHGTLRADATPDHARGAALGAVGSIAQSIGAAGVPLGGALALRLGPTAPFWLGALFMALAAVSTRALDPLLRRSPAALD